TLGLAGRREHLHDVGAIPVVATERGGQVTYHGPGQAVAYPLLDLRRRAMSVRCLVDALEQAAIDVCACFGVTAVRRPKAPGVYVADAGGLPGAKIASIGLKISRGCSLHGIALNVAMDLTPFERIDPCGYAGQTMTDLAREARRPLDLERTAALFGRMIEDRLK
ncbi:MAG TPA: lipoyl(octanoyl) transferase LipB, partial [Burkholderiaceae bacterium]|nr:lipoyl(octanoyl) transferase LipB [Burkholderiaceae bacterium]